MLEQGSPNELQVLRDRIAELEAARDQPKTVNVEGFEGLRELSRAIETKNLDVFLLNRSMPDRVFWTILIGIVVFALAMALIELRSHSSAWY
jgi:hypothetical protein